MSQQIDWVGNEPQPRPFRDIRNTRESAASEKARLCFELGELINKIPPAIKRGGSINDVREWRHARDEAAKVAGKSRSSAQELRTAINRMQPYWSQS